MEHIIDSPEQLVKIIGGRSDVIAIRELANARGIQFREVRLDCIASWDILPLSIPGATIAFDPLHGLELDAGPAIIVLSYVECAAPAVLECYSAIANYQIKVIAVESK